MQPLRRIVSMCLFFTFVLLTATAVVLYFKPSPGVAQWSDWSFLWISWRRYEAMHLGLGIALVVLAAVHAALHLDFWFANLRDKLDNIRPLGLAPCVGLALALIVAIDAAFMLPPLRQVFDYAARVQANAAALYGEPPYDSAWRSNLAEFCAKLGLDLDKVQNTLAAKHVMVASPDQTLEDIAGKNGITPAGIYDSIRPLKAEPAPGAKPSPLPPEPLAGMGRMTLAEFCGGYGLDTGQIVAKLATIDIRAGAAMTLNDMAKVNNRLPVEIYEALRYVSATAPGASGQNSPTPAVSVAPAQGAVHEPAVPGMEQAGQTPSAIGQPAQPGQVQAAPAQPGAGEAQKIEPPVGLGKMLISEFCKKYNIEQRDALKKLEAKNIQAFGDMTFNEIALENNLTPKTVMDIITN